MSAQGEWQPISSAPRSWAKPAQPSKPPPQSEAPDMHPHEDDSLETLGLIIIIAISIIGAIAVGAVRVGWL